MMMADDAVLKFLHRTEGEWAGWQCEFDADGRLKPVDDKYLDQVTIDYGQQPAGFEVFSTDRVHDGALVRRTLRFLPASGCACDRYLESR